MRKKELADEEIEKEFSNLTLNSDIHDWYKNKEDTSSFFDDSIKDIGYKEAVESIEKNNYKMHKKLIKRNNID